MTRHTLSDESEQTGRETGVSRRSILHTGATGVAALVGLVGLSTPVAAEQGAIFELFDERDDQLDRAISSLRGGMSRMLADEDKRTAEEAATETTTVFNENADVLVAYSNDRLSSTEKTSVDTIRLVFERDVTVERWLLADVDDSNAFVSARMTDTRPDRDVDHFVRLKRLACVDAPDELERFVDEYASEDRPVDSALEGRLAGRYGPDVESSLL